jgi:nicotinate phosphoribosyltransferase
MVRDGKELTNYGIRLDSGDIAYLSKKARATLNKAGFETAVISASGDLDEYLITDLKAQGAEVSVWGVGTNLITSRDYPAFGGVYKMAAVSEDGKTWLPKIKLSENPVKVTNPGVKKIFRLYDAFSGKIKADLIALDDERIDGSEDLTIFDPLATWKRMTLRAGEYWARELLLPVFENGECVYKERSVMEIREYSLKERASLWDEHKRLINPHPLPVDLSRKLYDLKQKMIADIKNEIFNDGGI